MSATAELPKTQEQQKRAEYKRPIVCSGLPIQYWIEGQAGPYPGQIICDSGQTVDLVYFMPQSTGVKIVSGARHRLDPENREMDVQNGGTWDLTEETKATRRVIAEARQAVASMQQLAEQYQELAAKVGAVEELVTQKA